MVNFRTLHKWGEGGLFQILTKRGGAIREGSLIELFW